MDTSLKLAFTYAAMVGSGGFLGALARYLLGGLVQRGFPLAAFPYGTLAVNLLGCLAIGVLAGISESRQWLGPELRSFVFIGVLGGFTTFSAFGFETIALMRDAEYLPAIANVALHVTVGLSLVWLGFTVATWRLG